MVRVLVFLAAAALPQQERPVSVEVRVRPGVVREGGTAVLTVRVTSGEGFPEEVTVDLPPEVELLDERERSSTLAGGVGAGRYVFERDLVLRPGSGGRLTLGPVWVTLGGETFEVPGTELEVRGPPRPPGPGAREGRRSRDGPRERADRILPEGRPPPSGELREVEPYAWPGAGGGRILLPWWSPGAGGYGACGEGCPPGWWGAPPGWSGAPPGWNPAGGWSGAWPGRAGPAPGPGGPPRGWPPSPGTPPAAPGGALPPGTYLYPPGRGEWAESAGNDPWWPELVPQLRAYDSEVRDPTGRVGLSVGVTPRSVFVGQQLTYVATVFLAPGVVAGGEEPRYVPPTPEGFWALDLWEPAGAPAAVGGRVQQGYTFRRALFPLAPGEVEIPGGRVELGSGEVLEAEPLRVRVLPLPRSSSPTAYGGAVGRYRLEGILSPSTLRLGESAYLVVRVVGAGYLQGLPPPDPGVVPGLEMSFVYDRVGLEVRDGVVGGVRTFVWLVTPQVAGEFVVGPVVYPYFDPYARAFGRAATDELLLAVTELDGATGPPPPTPGPDAGPSGTPPGPSPSAQATGLGPGSPDTAPPGAAPRPAMGTPGRPGGAPPGSRAPRGAARSGPEPMEIRPSRSPDPAFQAGVEAFRAGRPEEAVGWWRAYTALHPRDPAGWLALGRAYARARPGEGWDAWAWWNGLRAEPGDSALRGALEARTRSAPGVASGLRGGLARALPAGLLLWAAGAVAALAVGRRPGSREEGSSPAPTTPHRPGRIRRRWPGVLAGWTVLVLLGVGGAVLGRARASRARGGVVVAGAAPVRALPVFASPPVARLAGGTPVRVEERHGTWWRVRTSERGEGWVEGSDLALLEVF